MQSKLTKEQFAFVEYLTSLNIEDNRGTLAVLRRGLSGKPIENINLYRFVATHIPDSDRGTCREEVYYLLAALYATNPVLTKEGNFGSHMRQVADLRKDMEAAERRFTVLLNTRLEDLGKPLLQAVSMLKQQNELPVNWFRLFEDLLRWKHAQKYTQRAWANSFWGYERPINLVTNDEEETVQ